MKYRVRRASADPILQHNKAGATRQGHVYGIMEMAAVSYGGAIAAYAGQNYGAGRKERLKNGVRSSVLMAPAFRRTIRCPDGRPAMDAAG